MLLAVTGSDRSALLDLPPWARTIKRAVRHERLLAIKPPSWGKYAVSIEIRN
jgi:hypothetical protein